jgi:hypothetical protein
MVNLLQQHKNKQSEKKDGYSCTTYMTYNNTRTNKTKKKMGIVALRTRLAAQWTLSDTDTTSAAATAAAAAAATAAAAAAVAADSVAVSSGGGACNLCGGVGGALQTHTVVVRMTTRVDFHTVINGLKRHLYYNTIREESER